MSIHLDPKKSARLYCSFCGKEEDDVAYLVAGPQVFICNECVELCRQIGTEMLVVNSATLAESDEQDCIDMLSLCGDLGGKRSDETYPQYLRRLIDFVTTHPAAELAHG